MIHHLMNRPVVSTMASVDSEFKIPRPIEHLKYVYLDVNILIQIFVINFCNKLF